jgi:16S rRNA (guanine966-N2)-methyltransferase
MRIVAGTARGLRLHAPPGDRVRPTSDRVREALFNALGSLDAVEGARVLDLFAGTGALGIEALSRGATSVTFVERDPGVVRVLKDNVCGTGFDDRSDIRRADARRYLQGVDQTWDLALVDPPYAFDEWDALLADLPADLVVVESDRPIEVPEPWTVVRHRRYGGTVVTIARRSAPPDPSE